MRARQLRAELRTTRLDDRSITEFLARIKALADCLASVGDPVSSKEHLDVILEGLPQDYDSMISIIESKFDDATPMEEAEALLLAQEMLIQRYRKNTLQDLPSVNLTQSTQSSNMNIVPSSTQSQALIHTTQSSDEQYSRFRGSDRGRGGRYARGRGRGGRSSIQCQVCYKFGHIVVVCYHRFNQHFQSPPQPSVLPTHPQVTYKFQGYNQSNQSYMPPPTQGYNTQGYNVPSPQRNSNPGPVHFQQQ